MDWILIYLAFHCTVCLYLSVRNGRRNMQMLLEIEERSRQLDKTEAWLDRRTRQLEIKERQYAVLVKK